MTSAFARLLVPVGLLVMSVPAIHCGAQTAASQPAPVVRTPGQEAELARLKTRYGSRFLCEVSREQALVSAAGEGLQAAGLPGLAVGLVVGYAMRPDCALLEWTPADHMKMEMYRREQNTAVECSSRRSKTTMGWSIGGGVAGALVGGLGTYAVVGEGEGVLLAMVAALIGGGVGTLAGALIGSSKAVKCGPPPSPEEIDLGHQTQELRNTVPLVPSSSTVMQ